MTCPRCGEANPAEIHTCSPQATNDRWIRQYDEEVFVVFDPTTDGAHILGATHTRPQAEALLATAAADPPIAVITDPETLATQISFTMRLADAPLSEQQFVTLCMYLKARSQPE